MKKELFKRLVESMMEMGEIVRGEHHPSREFHVEPNDTEADREAIPPVQPSVFPDAQCGG
ncbi:hypothetical protein [Pseudomonas sp. SLFW]|uniref:hypothetical protein n=1 Tax=Pseudomonas sp. SLFW TaxID=2683259 RepID=UPI0014125984|nr:hypothetical protein [Pseudomonas sp. SLFW]NBB11689.1 hypothetical protein [Pseudomonas sp. SLFW]